MNFTPVNELEQALVAAVGDAAARPAFYRKLLESQVYIVPVGGRPEVENGTVKAGSQIALQALDKEGVRFTPFYSSPEMIARMSAEPVEYLALNARAFFEMTRGSALVMNPNSFGKEFLPAEVDAMLSGQLFEPRERHVAGGNEQVMIGQPSKFPQALAAALSKLFKGRLCVTKAFLAQYVNPARNPDPGLLIAVELDNPAEWDKVIGDAGVVIQSLHPDHKFADFIRYEAGAGGVFDYFAKSVKPFYQRGFISGMFGG